MEEPGAEGLREKTIYHVKLAFKQQTKIIYILSTRRSTSTPWPKFVLNKKKTVRKYLLYVRIYSCRIVLFCHFSGGGAAPLFFTVFTVFYLFITLFLLSLSFLSAVSWFCDHGPCIYIYISREEESARTLGFAGCRVERTV